MPKLKSLLKKTPVGLLFNPYGPGQFIAQLPKKARLLDVGCGKNSPRMIRSLRPDVHYVGIDVEDYNQIEFVDEYLVVSPEKFGDEIDKMNSAFDAVMWSHNVEHCFRPGEVQSAVMRALKPGGVLFMSFPCEQSVSFPSREGTLNFFDDPTHVKVPDYRNIIESLDKNGFTRLVSSQRYRPFNLFIRGLLAEPASAARKRVLRGTWALYGFESIIWAKKAVG